MSQSAGSFEGRGSRDGGSQRARVLALLRAFGWNATSFQILESGLRYWFEPAGCVAYVDTGRAWVAAGAPLAPEQTIARVAEGFVRAARAQGKSAVFFATERRFVEQTEYAALLIGEQPEWDPQHWVQALGNNSSLREQLRRARAKGVRVDAVTARELAAGTPLRQALERLITEWLRAKPMPPMGFLVQVDPFQLMTERRLFVARRQQGGEQEVVGFAAVIPVYARQGWFLEDLIRSARAPNGTTELLVDAAVRDAAALGSRYFTLGLSPLAGAVSKPLEWASRYSGGLYDFRGVRAFKSKFRPAEWSPIFLSHPRGESAVVALYHSLSAFAQRGLLSYGFSTLLRGPDIVLRALALLLLPWSALLGSLETERWFPSAAVQWAWIAFDLALALALWLLTRRFRRWLSALLVGLVMADTLLTAIEAAVFNLPRASPSAALWVLVGVLAPGFACVVLWRSHRRLSAIASSSEKGVRWAAAS
jgi:phosphatidylglycerol lysyltransferase